MKRLIYYISALLLTVSCAVEPEGSESSGYQVNLNVSIATKAGEPAGGSTDAEPVVNSMRVLIFYGNPSGSETEGGLVYNTFYDFGFNTARSTGKYTVSLANPIVLPQSDCHNYNVYAILNEDEFQLSGEPAADLHETLRNFSGTESEFAGILSTPVIYEAVLKNVDEPAFLMSGRKTVKFESGELGSVKTISISADSNPSTADFNRGRSMAWIVVDKITSEPLNGVDYSSSTVPLIFVKSVTLENIPNTVAWADNDGSTNGTAATKMASQSVGAAKDHEDGSGIYYDRSWYGQVTRTISKLWAQKIQYTDARFYRTGMNQDNDAGKTSWSFKVKPYREADIYEYQYAEGEEATGYNDHKPYNAILGLNNFAKGNDPAKHSSALLLSQLAEIFAATQDDNPEMSENISYTSYEITDVKGDGGDKTAIGPLELTDEYWTVRLGDEFYVPENVQTTDSTKATCLHVTLAIAQPTFSFSLSNNKGDKRVFTEDLTDDKAKKLPQVKASDLPSISSLPDEGSLTFNYYVGEGETLKKVSEMDANSAKANGKVVWADDEDTVLEIPEDGNERKKFCDDHGSYHVYIDGFSYRSDQVQTGTVVVNQDLANSTFNWNVPASDDASTHVYDFIIPVNNNLGGDGDFSVRRNTKYTVSLYVNQGTYNSLVTKAGAGAPFTVTAKVETENVSGYEE